MQTVTGKPSTWGRYTPAVLVEFERRVATGVGTYTSTYYRLTNAIQDITYSGAAGYDRPNVGAVFTSRPFRLSNIVQGQTFGSTVQIAFDDFDSTIKTLALLYAMVDWRVRIWGCGISIAFGIQWIKLKINGRMGDINWDVDNSDVTTMDVLGDATSAQTSGPREEFTPTCRFRFKSPRCGYVGVATTCDRSLNNCFALANQVRFGGFPDSPKPDDKLPLWGATIVIYPTRNDFYPQDFMG